MHANYTGFFECFNREEFFQAHDVLEELWLTVRGEPNGAFYKGLIQLAGAFVHVQKQRRGPALSLLRLAETNLSAYGDFHEQFDVAAALRKITHWKTMLTAPGDMPAIGQIRPELRLEQGSSAD